MLLLYPGDLYRLLGASSCTSCGHLFSVNNSLLMEEMNSFSVQEMFFPIFIGMWVHDHMTVCRIPQ
jgi:hypothetical protein